MVAETTTRCEELDGPARIDCCLAWYEATLREGGGPGKVLDRVDDVTAFLIMGG